MWTAVTLGLAAVDVWAWLWIPPSEKSPWAVPIITAFVLLCAWVTLTEVMRRRVVAQMREGGPLRAADAEPATVAQDQPWAPPPPLEFRTVTTAEVLGRREPESPRVAWARHGFDRALTIHRSHIYQLIAANLLLGLSSLFVARWYPLNVTLLVSLTVAPFGLRILEIGIRRRKRLTIQQAGWLALHAAWIAATAYVAAALLLMAIVDGVRGTGWPVGDAVLAAIYAATAILAWSRWWNAQRRFARERSTEPPQRLLFLWVFGDGMRVNSLLLGIGATWRFLGPLQFLQGGGMIGQGADTMRHLRGRKIIAASESDVDAALASFKWELDPNWGIYPTNSLLCGDHSWRYALNQLLETDAVLMDLSGFSPVNAGCVYEIGRIFDRIPLSRVVFLIDGATDLPALRGTMDEAWSRLAATSPNRQPTVGQVHLYRSEEEQGQKGLVDVGKAQRNADALLILLTSGFEDAHAIVDSSTCWRRSS